MLCALTFDNRHRVRIDSNLARYLLRFTSLVKTKRLAPDIHRQVRPHGRDLPTHVAGGNWLERDERSAGRSIDVLHFDPACNLLEIRRAAENQLRLGNRVRPIALHVPKCGHGHRPTKIEVDKRPRALTVRGVFGGAIGR